MYKGQVLLVISKDEFRITGKILRVKNVLPFLLHAHVENPWLAHVKISSPEAPVNNIVQAVFSSNSRIISRYCALFKFGAEAPLPGSGLR